MRRLLLITAALEALTGLALLAAPTLVITLLLGSDATKSSASLARLAGAALLSFGIACWPAQSPISTAAIRAMLVYNLLATAVLTIAGLSATSVGILLWPAVILHAIFAALFLRQRSKDRQSPDTFEKQT